MANNPPTRQRYGLATGQGLDGAPPRAGSPGYAKGGKVKSTGGVPKGLKIAGFKKQGRGK
jgi:hypothetical protein